MIPADATHRNAEREPTTPVSAFSQLGDPPSDDRLWRSLDLCAGVWETLVKEARLQARLGRTVWRFAEAGSGWQLFVTRPGRPSLILTPHEHGFTVTVTITREAARQALHHDTPADVQALLGQMALHGGPVHLLIRGWDTLQIVRHLAGLKGRTVHP